MEKRKNTKEDIRFLKRVAMITGIPVLALLLFSSVKCSHDKMDKNNEYVDYNGNIISGPDTEETTLILRRVK